MNPKAIAAALTANHLPAHDPEYRNVPGDVRNDRDVLEQITAVLREVRSTARLSSDGQIAFDLVIEIAEIAETRLLYADDYTPTRTLEGLLDGLRRVGVARVNQIGTTSGDSGSLRRDASRAIAAVKDAMDRFTFGALNHAATVEEAEARRKHDRAAGATQ